MSQRDVYEQKLRAKLDEWQAEIDLLRAKARSVHADANVEKEQEEEAERLEKQRDEMRERLNKMRDASDDAWDDLKDGAERAWGSISDSFEKARSRFK